jgi:arginine:ornithine antiporter/lysine permease
MILVPYLLVGLYLIKVVRGQHKPLAMATGIGASLYGIWLLYASGPLHLMMSVVLYTPGLLLFLFARRGGRAEFALTSLERIAMGLLIAATLPAVWQLTT